MAVSMLSRQRGISFEGFIIIAFLVVLFGISGLKLIPAYMENKKISNVFSAIAHDPEMQNASPADIQMSFSKRASIEDISAIKPDEIDISSENGMLELSASYALKVPLVANISFYLEFNPSSAE